MIVIGLFYLSFLAVVVCAIRWGDRPEQLSAIAFASAAVLSWLVHGSGAARWDRLQTGVLMIDVLLLLFLFYLSGRFERWWLIIVTALHLLSTGAHLARLADPAFHGFAYALMESMSAWGALPLLAIALLQTRRRRNVCSTSLGYSPWPDAKPRA